MKEMTCEDIGGICDLKFKANTFDAIAEKARAHGSEMVNKGDKAHSDAMEKMQKKMGNPGEMEAWLEKKRQEFDALPEVE